MALLSTKGVYGLSAMYQLFLAKTDNPMQIKEISQKAMIPKNYLEQLLILLRQAGLVKSIRGAYGGYVLGKNPHDISIKEILIAMEGTLVITEMETQNPVLRLFYEQSNRALQALFDQPLSEFDTLAQQLYAELNYSI
jgi:Rrf2 family protein